MIWPSQSIASRFRPVADAVRKLSEIGNLRPRKGSKTSWKVKTSRDEDLPLQLSTQGHSTQAAIRRTVPLKPPHIQQEARSNAATHKAKSPQGLPSLQICRRKHNQYVPPSPQPPVHTLAPQTRELTPDSRPPFLQHPHGPALPAARQKTHPCAAGPALLAHVAG